MTYIMQNKRPKNKNERRKNVILMYKLWSYWYVKQIFFFICPCAERHTLFLETMSVLCIFCSPHVRNLACALHVALYKKNWGPTFLVNSCIRRSDIFPSNTGRLRFVAEFFPQDISEALFCSVDSISTSTLMSSHTVLSLVSASW